MTEGISGHELLERVYSKLGKNNTHELIEFNNEVRTEIADDSDYHRSRTGYMSYKEVMKLNNYIIGLGRACGSYPAEPYDSDLLALKIKGEESRDNIIRIINRSTYFRNSLLFTCKDGRISGSRESELCVELLEHKLLPVLKEYIMQEPEYDKRYISASTLTPINTKKVLYKPELVGFLVNNIEELLKT